MTHWIFTLTFDTIRTFFYIPRYPPAGGRKLYTKLMWYVYALYNKRNDKIYIGITQNIERRLKEHNSKRGNHFTAKFLGSWVIIYTEKVGSHSKALLRENQLKSYRGREFIKQFILR